MATERTDLLASLLPITRALRRIEDVAASACGLTMWQYAVLDVVHARPGIGQGEAAALMDYSRNRIIADLDVLQDKGYLRRVAGTDRRVNTLHLTPAGFEVMRAVREQIRRGEDEMLSGLSPSARRDFGRISRQLARQINAARLAQ